MKKRSTGTGAAPSAARPAAGEVDEYIAAVPEPARTTLNKVRAAIRAAAPPEATEALSYRMPAFKYNGPLVAYAAFTKHCSLFPMSLAVMAALKDDLKGYDTDKGTIRFPLDKPLPAVLVKKIVKARVAEREAKKKR